MPGPAVRSPGWLAGGSVSRTAGGARKKSGFGQREFVFQVRLGEEKGTSM